MDKKLVKHLIIAIIIIALIIIFVPMFFGERLEKEVEETAIPTAPEEPALEQKLKPDTEEIEQKPEVLEETADDSIQQEEPKEPEETNQTEEENDDIIPSALAPIDTSVEKIEPAKVEKPTIVVKQSIKPEPPKKVIVSEKKVVAKTPVTKPKTAKISVKTAPVPTTNKKIVLKQIEKAKTYEKSWVVQLGSFVQIQRANLLIKKLRAKGFHAFGYRKILTPNQVINRVYVGPFSNIEEAKKTRGKLNDIMNIKGIVIKYDPTDID